MGPGGGGGGSARARRGCRPVARRRRRRRRRPHPARGRRRRRGSRSRQPRGAVPIDRNWRHKHGPERPARPGCVRSHAHAGGGRRRGRGQQRAPPPPAGAGPGPRSGDSAPFLPANGSELGSALSARPPPSSNPIETVRSREEPPALAESPCSPRASGTTAPAQT